MDGRALAYRRLHHGVICNKALACWLSLLRVCSSTLPLLATTVALVYLTYENVMMAHVVD